MPTVFISARSKTNAPGSWNADRRGNCIECLNTLVPHLAPRASLFAPVGERIGIFALPARTSFAEVDRVVASNPHQLGGFHDRGDAGRRDIRSGCRA